MITQQLGLFGKHSPKVLDNKRCPTRQFLHTMEEQASYIRLSPRQRQEARRITKRFAPVFKPVRTSQSILLHMNKDIMTQRNYNSMIQYVIGHAITINF